MGKLVSYHGNHIQALHVTVTGSVDTDNTGVGYVVNLQYKAEYGFRFENE